MPKYLKMAFIRKKTIYGNEYYYLVKNIRKKGKVKQKVIRYLGKSGFYIEKRETRTFDGLFKRKCRQSKMATYRSLTDKFFNSNLYKEIRGIVETIFGGLENKGLLKTRLRKPTNIFKYSLATAVNHNHRTSIVARLINFLNYFFETLRSRVC